MDNVGIPLIGVVPEDQNIKICGAKGEPLPPSCGGDLFGIYLHKWVSRRTYQIKIIHAVYLSGSG